MSSPQLIGAAIGLFIGCTVFWLIRRDHMVSRDGVRWIFIAAVVMVYGAFPGMNDMLGAFLGISYPPIIPVLLGLGAVLIKLLISDIERVKSRVDVERMVQRMAILEAEIALLKAKDGKNAEPQDADKAGSVQSINARG